LVDLHRSYSVLHQCCFCDTAYITVCPKASWAGLICRTHQHYHHHPLSNTEWSNFRRWAWTKDRWSWVGKLRG